MNKGFLENGAVGRWINPPLPERYAATPQRRTLYNSARGNGRANCNPPAHPTQSYSLLAKHTKCRHSSSRGAQGQNVFSSLCPPVSECSDWLSPASCFLHLPDCWPFCPWTDKLRHLGSTFPVLNSKRKLLSYGFSAPAIN